MQQHLFTPFQLKGLIVKNRIMMSPMCMYSVDKEDGIATAWHHLHYVSRAIGGTGLIMLEMTAVEPDGRITTNDLGLWCDEQIPALQKIVADAQAQGAKVGIQIGHAGRKAEDATLPVAPSAIAYDDNAKTPHALTTSEVQNMVEKYRQAARRAVQAGFDTIEIHGAHGYLIHQFHSPLTNQRDDAYGKDITRFGCEVIAAMKQEMPTDMPLLMRISAKEYVVDGYDIEDSIIFARAYAEAGVDMLDVSTGGEGAIAQERRPGSQAAYQAPFARKIQEALEIPVIAVGRLNDAILANAIVSNGEADMIAIGRGLLRNPYWALEASKQLRKETAIPKQYKDAFRY